MKGTLLLIFFFLSMKLFAEGLFSYVEPKLKDENDKKWFFNLSAWSEINQGNTDAKKANGSLQLKYNNGISDFLVSFESFYTVAKNEIIQNKSKNIIKYDHHMFPRIDPFLFVQSEYNEATSLIYRNNTGLGLKFTFFRNEFRKFDISFAPIYQYEKIENIPAKIDARLSNRVRFVGNFSSFLKAKLVIFYIPKIQEINNYRVGLKSSIEISLLKIKKKQLSLVLGYNYQLNSRPPEGINSFDSRTFFRLKLSI